VTRAYCSRHSFDDFIPLEVFIVANGWSNCKLWFRSMLASQTAAPDDKARSKIQSYLLPGIAFPMEMRCKDSFCNSFQALLIGLLDARDRSKAFHETTILVLNTVRSVLADLVDKRHRFHRRSCLKENHYSNQSDVSCNQ